MAKTAVPVWMEGVTQKDLDRINRVLGGGDSIRPPDETIYAGGKPYIYRWHILPNHNDLGANIYLHLQVADDAERAMHDHPWDNQSIILAGGYREKVWDFPPATTTVHERDVKAGQVVHRSAEAAHRLSLLPGVPYTLSLFTTGPKVREWGFWIWEPAPHWVHNTEYREGKR